MSVELWVVTRSVVAVIWYVGPCGFPADDGVWVVYIGVLSSSSEQTTRHQRTITLLV